MVRPASAFLSAMALVVTLCCNPTFAAVPSDRLLPTTTKGYLSIQNAKELAAKWDETQLGHLAADPLMEPFVEDFKRQLKSKLSQAGVRVGVTLDDLKGVYSGEIAMAMVQPDGKKDQHATVLLVDVTGHEVEARELLDKINVNQGNKGGRRSTFKIGEVDVVNIVLPKQPDQTEADQAFYFIHHEQLVATDHRKTAEQIISRLGGTAGDSLSKLKAYENVRQQSEKAAGEFNPTPHIRWFVEPFGYVEVSRAAGLTKKKRGKDLLKVLANQGFNAVQGLGGNITFATDEHELIHRTFVYAPAADGASGNEKYKLAARILNFPANADLAPLPWVPRDIATHLTFRMKIKEAFVNIGTLIDEMADAPGVWDDIKTGIKTDPNGPQVDLDKELVAHAGERITFLSDYRLPITTKCERIAVAIEVTNSKAVEKAINKIMEADPNANRREVNGHTIWEIINDEQNAVVDDLVIEGAGFTSVGGPVAKEKENEDEEKPTIPNSAVTVAHGHLIIATHLDFVRDLIKMPSPEESLAKSADFQVVNGALEKLGSGADSFRAFSRTDEAYRPTFELVRQGKMPQSETMLGKMLNSLADDGKGTPREQVIDGAKLPEYQAVRRYLGPAGVYVRTETDGWLITGCLLKKELAN